MEVSSSHKLRVEKQFDYYCKIVVSSEMKDIRQHESYLLEHEKALMSSCGIFV